MASDDNKLDSTLDRYMGRAGEPPAAQVASSVEAVWERLSPEADRATLPPRRIVTRRSHFNVAAAVLAGTIAIGLYAAQRAGLFEATRPLQQQTQRQVPPAAHPPAAAVDPVRERVTSGGVAKPKESKELNITSRPPADATASPLLSQRVGAVADPMLRLDGKPSRGTTGPGTSLLAFAVASIRPVPPPIPTAAGPWTVTNGRFRAERGHVRNLIEWAFSVRSGQVKGGPDWIDREAYDFDARAESVAAGPDQLRLMLQTLFAERFKLALHFDTEDATVYTLVVAKNGPKLQDAKGGQPYGNWTGRGQVTVSNVPLSALTNILSDQLDNAQIFDETGLRGTYDFSLEFTRPRDPRTSQTDAPPDLFTALQEQLGLELRASRRQVEVVVIDYIERPSQN